MRTPSRRSKRWALCWRWQRGRRRCVWIHFVDNESAKNSLIEGSSRAVHTNEIVHATWEECRSRCVYPWRERVASADNPVDKASRGNLADLYEQWWVVVDPVLPDIWRRGAGRS